MQQKVDISENRSRENRITFLRLKMKDLTISTHFKTGKIVVENEYFKKLVQ